MHISILTRTTWTIARLQLCPDQVAIAEQQRRNLVMERLEGGTSGTQRPPGEMHDTELPVLDSQNEHLYTSSDGAGGAR